jgi:hypothetical protein
VPDDTAPEKPDAKAAIPADVAKEFKSPRYQDGV